MAKVLSIGAKYIPNMKAGVDQNGKTIFSPTVLFYFNCDNRTANVVAGSGVAKGLAVDGDALVRAVKVDDYIIFYINENCVTFLIMTGKSYPKEAAVGCLQSIKREFNQAYEGRDFDGELNYGLNDEFREKLKLKFNDAKTQLFFKSPYELSFNLIEFKILRSILDTCT